MSLLGAARLHLTCNLFGVRCSALTSQFHNIRAGNRSMKSKSISTTSALGDIFTIQDESDYKERVEKSKEPVIVDFYATYVVAIHSALLFKGASPPCVIVLTNFFPSCFSYVLLVGAVLANSCYQD